MGYVIYHIISSYKGFFSLNTAITFLIPFLLSIGLMPLLYLIALYASYEQIFTYINIATNKEKAKKYAKKEVLKHCHLNLKRAQGYAYGEALVS